MISYILRSSRHSRDWQSDPRASIQAQALWYHKVILQKFGRKHELLASVLSDLRDTIPCLQFQSVCRFPTHRHTEPTITILLPLVIASCISNGWRRQSQENMKFQQKRSWSTRFFDVVVPQTEQSWKKACAEHRPNSRYCLIILLIFF